MTYEEVLKEYEIDTPEYLKKLLDDYDESAKLTICIYAFLEEYKLVDEFRKFIKEDKEIIC